MDKNIYKVKFTHIITEEIEAFIESEHDRDTAEALFVEKMDASVGPENYDIEYFTDTDDEEKEQAQKAKQEWEAMKEEYSAYADNNNKTVH